MAQGRRWLILVGLAVILLNLLRAAGAVGPATSQWPLETPLTAEARATDPATGTIVVTVLQMDGRLAAGLLVSATGEAVRSGLTDEQGTVRLASMSPGAYIVTVERQGYTSNGPRWVELPDGGSTISAILVLAADGDRAAASGSAPAAVVQPTAPATPGEQLIEIPPDRPGSGT